ncbi:MAK10-like protein [Tanacetum coccineum]|uniref:MAK10-like protein n=1 Tax=Tanacetum coccineum TaxID=301880 RepID=A0ABQ5BQB3_9ASTR
MGDENPIRTLGDYSKPSHEGYMNTIKLPVRNNVVPLRSDTIRERTRLRLFQFSLRDQASNLLERLPAGSISTYEDLTTRFLAQFFLPGRTAKLCNDILMFQQHHGESLSEAWTRFKDLLQKVPHHGIDLYLQVQIFYDHVNPVTRRTIDQSASGKLHDLNAKESWALLDDLFLYDNESWNDPRDFAKPVKETALPQDVPSISHRRLIELENQVQRLMEAHLAPTQPTQENKITNPCEICSGPHDTQYCMEDPEQAFVEYASSRTNEAGEGLVSEFMASQDARLSKFEVDFKRQQEDGGEIMRRKLDHKENANKGISNFVGRIKGMHVFVGNFTYVVDFMIVEDISLIIDPRLSQVVLGEPFVEISNMTHDPPEGVVRFIKGDDEVPYKMAHKIEQYDSLSDLEKEHTKSVYLRNEEDKRRRVEYVMSKILGFYKECLELGYEYLTGIDDEGEVT